MQRLRLCKIRTGTTFLGAGCNLSVAGSRLATSVLGHQQRDFTRSVGAWMPLGRPDTESFKMLHFVPETLVFLGSKIFVGEQLTTFK
jgi:hypothetical protein